MTSSVPTDTVTARTVFAMAVVVLLFHHNHNHNNVNAQNLGNNYYQKKTQHTQDQELRISSRSSRRDDSFTLYHDDKRPWQAMDIEQSLEVEEKQDETNRDRELRGDSFFGEITRYPTQHPTRTPPTKRPTPRPTTRLESLLSNTISRTRRPTKRPSRRPVVPLSDFEDLRVTTDAPTSRVSTSCTLHELYVATLSFLSPHSLTYSFNTLEQILVHLQCNDEHAWKNNIINTIIICDNNHFLAILSNQKADTWTNPPTIYHSAYFKSNQNNNWFAYIKSITVPQHFDISNNSVNKQSFLVKCSIYSSANNKSNSTIFGWAIQWTICKAYTSTESKTNNTAAIKSSF